MPAHVDWDTPVIPTYIKKDASTLVAFGDNDLRQGVEMGLTPDDINRIREGYVCIKCKEPQPRPFPKTCSLCGLPMAEAQRELFAKLYHGTATEGRDWGSSIDWTDELDRLDWELEQDNWEAAGNVPGIIVPKGSQ